MILALLFIGWLLSLAAAVLVTFHFRRLVDAVANLKDLTSQFKKPPDAVAPSTVIDPDDVAQMARFEHNQMMKKLNPDKDL